MTKAKTDKEGSTLNAHQPIVGQMVLGGTSYEGQGCFVRYGWGSAIDGLSVAPTMVLDETNL